MSVRRKAASVLPAAIALLSVGCKGAPGKPKAAGEIVRPEQVTDLATLYKENCAACHGERGAAISLVNLFVERDDARFGQADESRTLPQFSGVRLVEQPIVLYMVPKRLLTVAFWWVCAALVGALSILAYRAPQAVSADASPTRFSAQRALVHVQHIAEVPHPVGTAAHEASRQYLLGSLRGMGLDPEIQNATGITTVADIVVATTVSNILVRIKGQASTGAVLLAAHYDSVENGPGASDDGAGVATLLETLRAISSSPPLKNDVIVLITDGEEHDMSGAEAYMSAHIKAGSFEPGNELVHVPVGIVLNFDNRGDKGVVNMFETSEGNSWLIDGFSKSPSPFGSSLMYTAYLALPNNTDFTVFKRGGLAGLNFAMVQGFQSYHTRLDTYANLNPGSLQQMGSYALSLATYFGNRDLTGPDGRQHDSVFFNPWGSLLVHYPMAWVWPIEAVILLLLIALIWMSRKIEQVRIGPAVAGVLMVLVATALTGAGMGLLATLVRRILGDRLLPGETVSNSLLILGLVVAGAAIAVMLRALCRRLIGVPSLRVATLFTFWLVSILLSLRLPATSYLYAWPAATVIVISLATMSSTRMRDSLLLTMLFEVASTVPALALFAPLIYLLFILLGASPVVGVISGVMLAQLVFLFREHDGSEKPGLLRVMLVGGAAAVVSAMLLIAGVHLSRFSPEEPRMDSIAYAVNPDEGKAAWVSFDDTTDSWTSRFLGSQPHHGVRTDLLGTLTGPVLWADADVVAQAGPSAHVLTDSVSGTDRTVELNVRSQVQGDRIQLSWPGELKLEGLEVQGRDVDLKIGNDKPGNVGLQIPPHRLEMFGVPAEGMTVKLSFPANGAHRVTVLEYMPGLGHTPQPTAAASRPPDSMPSRGSDMTYIVRSLPL